MNKKEAIDFIENRNWVGSATSLKRMKELMAKLNDPQKKLHFIHVAGTNGKGSCCASLMSVLKTAGYKTGLFTSPHLIEYNERFMIDGENISDDDFCLVCQKVKEASVSLSFVPKVFEILTAIAFVYFEQKQCDVVVLEVGMGGRLDATNVIDRSDLSIIMNIGLEHTEVLGDTLAKIAYEKAGIIKEKGEVIAYDNVPEVIDVFKKVTRERSAHLKIADFSKIRIISKGIKGQIFDYKQYKNIELALLGEHQFNNAAVVVEAVRALNKHGYHISAKQLKDGLLNTVWAARLSLLSKEPLFILDGAHNPQCAQALRDSLPELLKKKKAVILCGVLRDKDYESVMDMMVPFAKEFVCVSPISDRALNAEELRLVLDNKGVNATACMSIEEGIALSLRKAGSDGVVLAFGSLYLAGHIAELFPGIYKSFVRELMIEKRTSLSKHSISIRSKKIVQKIKDSDEFKNAKSIMLYKPIKGEADISALAKESDKIFCYPCCLDDKNMCAYSSKEFIKGKYGILEPLDGKLIDPDLIIVPVVAYTNNNERLGYGKGYYDRYLSEHKKAVKIGVAYDFQKLSSLPQNKNDVVLDKIVSDK